MAVNILTDKDLGYDSRYNIPLTAVKGKYPFRKSYQIAEAS